jgi:hypothetical protein
VSEDRTYRGVTLRRRYRDRKPNGWWLLPEGHLEGHPDRGWVPTIEDARAEIDSHASGGPCLLRDGDRWLGVLASWRVGDSIFDLTILRGFSPWCAARHGLAHDPCSAEECPCECHS